MRKVVMMLGASKRHAPFIKQIRDKGLLVLGIDKDEDAPGKEYCNFFAPISVRDTDMALSFAEAHGISACIAIPDIGAETGAYINSKMNLRGMSHFTYKLITDKRTSKLCFREASIDTPADYPDGAFPYIAKPFDSTGSNGIIKFGHKEQLQDKLVELRSKGYIIEEYIEGDMFSVDALVQDGEIRYGLVQDRFLWYEDCFVDSLIISPSKYGSKEYTDILFPLCKKVIKALSFKDGPINLQFRERDGVYYLIEVNPRISGPYGIECHTLATHIDWFNDIVDVALGYRVLNADVYPLIRPNALITIGAKENGFISHVTYPEITGKVDAYWRWKGDGDYVHKMKIVKDSIEHLFIMGDDLVDTILRAYSILKETQVHIGGIEYVRSNN